jgi:hypothetical protein
MSDFCQPISVRTANASPLASRIETVSEAISLLMPRLNSTLSASPERPHFSPRRLQTWLPPPGDQRKEASFPASGLPAGRQKKQLLTASQDLCLQALFMSQQQVLDQPQSVIGPAAQVVADQQVPDAQFHTLPQGQFRIRFVFITWEAPNLPGG